jgi:hypothetical protein
VIGGDYKQKRTSTQRRLREQYILTHGGGGAGALPALKSEENKVDGEGHACPTCTPYVEQMTGGAGFW